MSGMTRLFFRSISTNYLELWYLPALPSALDVRFCPQNCRRSLLGGFPGNSGTRRGLLEKVARGGIGLTHFQEVPPSLEQHCLLLYSAAVRGGGKKKGRKQD